MILRRTGLALLALAALLYSTWSGAAFAIDGAGTLLAVGWAVVLLATCFDPLRGAQTVKRRDHSGPGGRPQRKFSEPDPRGAAPHEGVACRG